MILTDICRKEFSRRFFELSSPPHPNLPISFSWPYGCMYIYIYIHIHIIYTYTQPLVRFGLVFSCIVLYCVARYCTVWPHRDNLAHAVSQCLFSPRRPDPSPSEWQIWLSESDGFPMRPCEFERVRLSPSKWVQMSSSTTKCFPVSLENPEELE